MPEKGLAVGTAKPLFVAIEREREANELKFPAIFRKTVDRVSSLVLRNESVNRQLLLDVLFRARAIR